VGFAIPVDIVKRVMPELISLGRYRHPWVGVTGTSISPEMVEMMQLPVETGVLIFRVEPDGPAFKAGLKGGDTDVIISGRPMREGGDILVAIGETAVDDFDDLVNYLARNTSVGDTVSLTVIRNGVELEVELVLEERPSDR
jgi:serine protease Do